MALSEEAKRVAIDLWGAYPVGSFCGIQFWVDPSMKEDRLRIVDPVTHRTTDIPVPTSPDS